MGWDEKFDMNLDPNKPFYILDEDRLPRKATIEEYVEWLATNPNRDVARDRIEGTNIRVVTVFLFCPVPDIKAALRSGLVRRSFYGTLVRGGLMDGHEEMHPSLEAAEDGHKRILDQVKRVLAGQEEVPSCCKSNDHW